MKTNRSLTTLLLMALPLTAACGSKNLNEMTDRATNTPYSASARPASVKGAHVDNVTMGKKLSADGTILSDDQANKFAPGDPIYITMQVGTALAGSPVKVAWYDTNNQKVGEDQKTIAKHETQVSFQAKNAASWAPGDYRVEVWMGDQKLSTQQFTIADRSS